LTTETKSAAALPTIAIVGRPNVGKSTLFNRIIRKRRAIVGDEPGITRDRLYGEAEWNGRTLRIVDTGGIVPDDPELIPAEIFRQARVAFDEADAIIMVIDGRTELASPDIDLARLLQRSGKPLFLAVNKMDTPELETRIHEFHSLGIRELFPVSAEHSNGVADLLDAVLDALPVQETPNTADTEETEETRGSKRKRARESKRLEGQKDAEGANDADSLSPDSPVSPESSVVDAPVSETKIAIIGRPNVGKSTLLNALTNSTRAIVSPIPGTTRDAVDELVERPDGSKFRFIDTAGIRRKGKTHLMAEKLSVIMARKHLEEADIALVVIDATEGVTAIDANIAGYAHESGRSVIIVINKWDLLIAAGNQGLPASNTKGQRVPQRPADRKLYEEQIRRTLKFLNYAPIIFISAVTGHNIDKVYQQLEIVARERRKRITTGEMNRFLAKVDFERASVPMSKRVRIYYMTQAAVSPPTFLLFTDRAVKLHFSYERFLENQIRDAFGFIGTPIWIKNRPKNRKDKE
jgi:GTP-binding protein